MIKELITYKDMRDLLGDLQKLRRLRYQRKKKISFWFRRRFFREKLQNSVAINWSGGYVHFENGDFIYIPKTLDFMGLQRLTEPYMPEPILTKFCKPGGTSLDIGANLGEWTLAMANGVGPAGRVIAFEPIPFMYEAIQKTLQVNQLSQASVFNYALSNKSGTAEFSVEYNDKEILSTGGSRLGTGSSKGKTIIVQTITLDEFISKHSIAHLNFLKIDVEGHEASVLEGGTDTIKKFKPIIILEAGCNAETEENRRKVRDFLQSMDYEIIGIALDRSRGIMEVNWDQYLKLDPPFIKNCAINLLMIPKS